MPTEREREYYARGFQDGAKWFEDNLPAPRERDPVRGGFDFSLLGGSNPRKPKRKLSAWQRYIKNPRNQIKYTRSTNYYKKGQLNLKAMGVQYRKKKR